MTRIKGCQGVDSEGGQNSILCLLQLAGGTFPTGSFSQSWGLETYISRGEIKNYEQFREFLIIYLENVLVKCEAPALCKAYDLGSSSLPNDQLLKELAELDQLLTAMKLTRESKEASLRTGKAFLRIITEVIEDLKIRQYYENYHREGLNFSISFGLTCGRFQLGRRNTLEGFLFSSINGLIQSAIKLVPLGNSEAQRLSFSMQDYIKRGADTAEKLLVSDICNFSPGLDIASMNHEDLPTRLYMS